MFEGDAALAARLERRLRPRDSSRCRSDYRGRARCNRRPQAAGVAHRADLGVVAAALRHARPQRRASRRRWTSGAVGPLHAGLGAHAADALHAVAAARLAAAIKKCVSLPALGESCGRHDAIQSRASANGSQPAQHRQPFKLHRRHPHPALSDIGPRTSIPACSVRAPDDRRCSARPRPAARSAASAVVAASRRPLGVRVSRPDVDRVGAAADAIGQGRAPAIHSQAGA